MNRLGKWFVAMTLVATLGGHWALLQGLAWTTMLARYSQSMPLTEAVTFTFDGKHPCKMCLAVQKGQQEENKEAKLKPVQKLVLILDGQVLALLPPPPSRSDMAAATLFESRFEEPPLPPPRKCAAALTEPALRAGVRREPTATFAASSKPLVRIPTADAGDFGSMVNATGQQTIIGTSPIRRSEVPRLRKSSPASRVTRVNSKRTCTNTGANPHQAGPAFAMKAGAAHRDENAPKLI